MLSNETAPAPTADQTDTTHLLRIIIVVLLVHDFLFLIFGLFLPIAGFHDFRQAQTAISVYWMLHGGSWLTYETPVLGAPWALPFEFPLYHWCVAAVAYLGMPLDGAGRLVSFAFFIGCLWPIKRIFAELNIKDRAYYVTSILFLASPLYIFWGMTFMIETCAVFFGFAWLSLFISFSKKASVALFVLTFLAGTAALLVKATTFPAFAFMGGVYFLFCCWQMVRRGIDRIGVISALAMAVLLLGPFGPAIAWVSYSDAVKLANPVAGVLTSVSLATWNFGTGEQRISQHLWVDVILARTMINVFGLSAFVLGTVAVVMIIWRKGQEYVVAKFVLSLTPEHRGCTAALLIAFLLPFLIFTNLHIVHDYYQTANGVFAIVLLGFLFGESVFSENRTALVTAISVMTVGQLLFFYGYYYDNSRHVSLNRVEIAASARRLVPEDAGIVVIGDDWSSIIPYYAERKALTVPEWLSKDLIQSVIAQPQRFFDNRPIGGVIECRQEGRDSYFAQFKPLLERRKVVAKNGNCELYM